MLYSESTAIRTLGACPARIPNDSSPMSVVGSPNYDDESGSSSLVNVRGQLPYFAGAQYVFRLKLPIVTSAPPTAVRSPASPG